MKRTKKTGAGFVPGFLRGMFLILPQLLVLALMLSLMALRASAVDKKVGRYIACPDCFDSTVFFNDMILLSLVYGILLLAGFLKPAFIARCVQLIAGFVILIYLVDLILFHLFFARLFMSDAALYIGEREAVWDQFYSGMGGPLAAPLLLLGVVLLFLLMFLMKPARQRAPRMLLAIVLGLSVIITVLVRQQPYVNSWAVDNVFAANLSTTTRNPYSDSFTDRQSRNDFPHRVYDSGLLLAPANGRNLIVVLLESWSSWHSLLFGGFENWTPNLDAAANRGLRFSNFHAIGFSTAEGLMGILAGEPLWAPFIHWRESTPFHSMWAVERTLPKAFLSAAYHTAFLTTGPLDIYRKGEWLEQLGFQYVEGRENSFYRGWPEYSFKSASDRALYQRANQWLHSAEKPYLLVLETLTTHQPFKDPDSGKRSLELAMKYADREFGVYLDLLDQSGFFDDGLLVVLSDHRSMTPISSGEFALFGNDAYSRVPMFVIGREFGRNQVDHSAYSQSDLVPTFEWWLTGKAALESNDAVMFSAASYDAKAPAANAGKCAFHARGNQRDLVDVICDGGRGVIKLDGDQTRFLQNQGLNESTRESLLADIARIRLQGLDRHQQQTTTD